MVGWSSGWLEVWDVIEGVLCCSSEEVFLGIIVLVFLDKRIVVVWFNGFFDFFFLEIYIFFSFL